MTSFLGFRSGANANLINKELGIYPLHSAAKRRDLEAMKILVEHGSNIDINTISRSSGQTALHLCADQVNRACQILLEHLYLVNVSNKYCRDFPRA